MSTAAIVRTPSPRVAEGEVTHLARAPVDVERARAQQRADVDVPVTARDVLVPA